MKKFMTEEELKAFLELLESLKNIFIDLGKKGGSKSDFVSLWVKNRIGFNKDLKDGHDAEIVAAFFCALVGANVIASAKADKYGADLIVNGLPIQIKLDWKGGSCDDEYKYKWVWIDGYKESVEVVYLHRTDDWKQTVERLLPGIKLKRSVANTIKEVWEWFC